MYLCSVNTEASSLLIRGQITGRPRHAKEFRHTVSRLQQKYAVRAPLQNILINMNIGLLASQSLSGGARPVRSAPVLVRQLFRGANQVIYRQPQRDCPRAAPGRSAIATQATAASENGLSTVRMSVQVRIKYLAELPAPTRCAMHESESNHADDIGNPSAMQHDYFGTLT